MATISEPVGRGLKNQSPSDVLHVQQMLNKHRQTPLRLIEETGEMNSETIAAIEEFQHRVVKMKFPDGRIDPGGRTLQALEEPQPVPLAMGPNQLAAGLIQNGVHNHQAQANANAVRDALVARGITSKRAQANVLAQVFAECGFLPRSEGNYRATTLFTLYGSGQKKNKVRFQTLEDAQKVVNKGPEEVFNTIYGDRMGNDKPGDGFKYRGRGFIQLTGKDNYRRVGTAIGEDLVGDPDRANDPQVATKILLNFLGVSPASQTFLEDINKVNSKVGPAGSPAIRGKFADSILPYLEDGPKQNVPTS